MTIKSLIKQRSLLFLHPNTVKKANEEEIEKILKSISYFRNFKIFKTFYTLLYKNSFLTLENYKDLYNTLYDYKNNHPKDFFISGFSQALLKSDNIGNKVKSLYALMIYNQLYQDNIFDKYTPTNSKRLQKSIENYYFSNRSINLIRIKKGKILKINNDNIVKSILRF
jgi:hypothetical protein